MASDRRVQAFLVASAVSVVLGLAFVLSGSGATVATVGVVVLILGVVFFLLALGLYFADEETNEAAARPTTGDTNE